MTDPVFETQIGDGVVLLRMDRPDSRNALSLELMEALVAGLERCDRDPEVRCVVLTGGERFFAAGADVRELDALSPAGFLTSERRRCWDAIRRVRVPTVAAVAGFALGGGCELALSCSLVVAADDAAFGQPEARLGILPGAGGVQRWARAAGAQPAAEVVLTGRPVSAWRARDLGVVNRVVPREWLIEAALELAREVAAAAPLATRFAATAIEAAEEMPLGAAIDGDRGLVAALLETRDAHEGIAAALGRRRPEFEAR